MWAIPHYQILSVMKTHPLICFLLCVINAEGLQGGPATHQPAPAVVLSFPFLFSLLKLQTRTSFPDGLGCVLSSGWFGVKLLCAGLVLKDSVPQGASPVPSVGSRPAVLRRRQHSVGSKL